MSEELSKYLGNEAVVRSQSENFNKNTEKEQRAEALKKILDHAQNIYMESNKLPLEISKAVELKARAQESLIEGQRKVSQPKAGWDKDGYNRARQIGNLREQAIHQLEEALKELKEMGQTSFVDVEREAE